MSQTAGDALTGVTSRSIVSVKEPYKPGSIRRVCLQNFMCHESFELDIGPKVNFIIGPNGSGKSAILAAIMVALGGRASITGRGKKMSEFINYGKSVARVSIDIHNYEKIMEKDRAFKPDDYGKIITVERTISREEGTTKLVIKNSNGKKVHDKKFELDDMIDHFGILINNPICILNQEVSKTFLHSKRGEDKFELLMKATNLEQIELNYAEARARHKDWEDCNNRKAVAYALLEKEEKSCNEKTKYLENRSRMNDTYCALQCEYVHGLVRDSEAICENKSRELQKTKQEIVEAEKFIHQRDEKIKNYKQDIETMQLKSQSITAGLNELKQKLHEQTKKEFNVKDNHAEIQQKTVILTRKIKRLNEEKTDVERSIEETKRDLEQQADFDNDAERRKLDIERLERELPHDKAREQSLRTHNEQLNSSMSATRSDLSSATYKYNDVISRLMKEKGQLTRLKNGQQDQLRKYGDSMIKLKSEIEAAFKSGKFKKKPIGPLGYFLKLKTKDVAGPLELVLGRASHAFACDNYQDMSQLSQIFNRFSSSEVNFRRPLIITRPYGPKHVIGRFSANHPIHKTLLDYVSIENPVVFNAIVDRSQLESILFIPDFNEAQTIMLDPKQVPENTKSAYTLDCSVMFPNTRNTGYKCFSNNKGRLLLFTEKNDDAIAEISRQIERLESESRESQSIVQRIQANLDEQKKESDRVTGEIRKVLADIRKKENDLLDLKTKVTIEPVGIAVLEEELSKVIISIKREEALVESLFAEINTQKEELQMIVRHKQEINAARNKNSNDLEAIMKMIESTNNNIKSAGDAINEKKVIIKRKMEEAESQAKSLDKALENLARTKQAISDDMEKPEEIRPTEFVKDELRKIEAHRRIDEEDDQDPVEVLNALRRRMAEIKNIKDIRELNGENFGWSKQSLEERREGFDALMRNTLHSVSTTFNTVMRSMDMRGELGINVDDVIERGEVVKKARTLEMFIETNYNPSQRVNNVMSDVINHHRRSAASQPAEAPRAKRLRSEVNADVTSNSRDRPGKENAISMTDTRSLSGGERSFATVAFVLALWYHCPSPFKLMDEIDVFMDMVTRRVSYNALIRFAQATDDSGQFIFFSPLELPKIDISDTDIRVFEMPEIVRAARTQQALTQP